MNEFVLQVLSGAQAGKKIRVDGPLSLGRSEGSGLSFSGADASLVSSQHASLEIEGENLVIRDGVSWVLVIERHVIESLAFPLFHFRIPSPPHLPH